MIKAALVNSLSMNIIYVEINIYLGIALISLTLQAAYDGYYVQFLTSISGLHSLLIHISHVKYHI